MWIASRVTAAISSTTAHVLLIVFVATLIRSTFGFGEGLIAVPLLAFTLPIAVAAPLVVLLSITIAAIVVLQDWHKIHFRSVGWLLVSTFAGIPLGIALLTSGHQHLVKAGLALVILAFSGYSLAARNPPRRIADIPELPGVMAYGASKREAESKVQAIALRVIADNGCAIHV